MGDVCNHVGFLALLMTRMASGFTDTMKEDMVTRKPNIVYPFMPPPVITLSGMSKTESAQTSCIATISKREGDEDRMSEKRSNGGPGRDGSS